MMTPSRARAPREVVVRSAAWIVGLAGASLLVGGCLLADPRPSPWEGRGDGTSPGAGSFSGIPSAEDSDKLAPTGLFDLAPEIAVSGGSSEGVSRVTLVGVPGALPGFGGVEVENLTAGGRTLSFSDPAGSFALDVDAMAGDYLSIRHLADDGTGALNATPIEVRVVSDAAASSPGSLSVDALIVSPPDASGFFTVTGDPGAAPPGVIVIVGNVSGAGGSMIVADVDGTFSQILSGGSGDRVAVFAASSLDPTSTTPSLELLVP